jgi:hypothetical protein
VSSWQGASAFPQGHDVGFRFDPTSNGQALDGARGQVSRACDARRESVREAHAFDGVRGHARDVPSEASQCEFAREFLRERFQTLVECRDSLARS